jgi:hypothetical protein
MKEIQLTQGKVALVDDEDYARVSALKWNVQYDKTKDRWVAVRRGPVIDGKSSTLMMHRFILGITDMTMEVDHIYHDTLDNRKSQLRVVTSSQNNQNRHKSKNCSSKYKGVCYVKRLKKWSGYITVDRKIKYLGLFLNEIDAAKEYNKMAIIHFGECCLLNQIDEG